MEDRERQPRAQISYLEEAVKFAYDSVDDSESNTNKQVSSEPTLSLTRMRQETKTDMSFTRRVPGDDLQSTSNCSTSGDYNQEHNETRPITLIVVLANPDLEFHFYKESDPDMFVSNKKLLILFIHSKMYSLSSKLCRAYTSPPCINLLAETMLSNHSLSLARCDQCCRGWFGPMPNSEMLKNKTSLDYNPALAYISCYRIASVEDYKPALAYISCYRIASVEDYNSALAYIYHVTE